MSADVERMIGEFDGVVSVNGLLTARLAPDEVIAIASVTFDDALRTPDIERLIEAIEDAFVERHPQLGNFFVKAQTPEAFKAAKRRRFGDARRADVAPRPPRVATMRPRIRLARSNTESPGVHR